MPSSSELFRRAVVLPLNLRAESELRADCVTDLQSIKVVAFSDDEQFYRIWASGVFEAVNRKCGSLIDDYESTELNSELPVLLEEICKAEKEQTTESEVGLFSQLDAICSEAMKLKRSLFLIF